MFCRLLGLMRAINENRVDAAIDLVPGSPKSDDKTDIPPHPMHGMAAARLIRKIAKKRP